MSRGVLLGQTAPRRRTILVPPGMGDAERPIVGVCHVIVDGNTGEQCGQRFYRGQEAAWEKHAVACATKHIDEIRAASPAHRLAGTVLDENEWDPEVQAHMLRVGERMRKTGDYTIRPRERAGF